MRIVLFLGVLLLSACQHTASVRERAGVDTFLGLTGASVRLLEPLNVAPGRARVFVQSGRIHRRYSVNEYLPQCNFEIDSVAHQGLTIRPGVFRITGVQRVMEQVVYLRERTVASRSIAMFDDPGSSQVFFGYHFWLDAPGQPGLMRMTCHGAYADRPEAQPPTLVEIREALGRVAKIDL